MHLHSIGTKYAGLAYRWLLIILSDLARTFQGLSRLEAGCMAYMHQIVFKVSTQALQMS